MSLSWNKKLITAVANNRIDEAKDCLDQGANIHADGNLALSTACAKGYVHLVKFLVNCEDANVHAKGGPPDYLPGYAFIRACHFSNVEVCEFLATKANLCPYAGYVLQKMVMKQGSTKGGKLQDTRQDLLLPELKDITTKNAEMDIFRKAVKETSGVRKTTEFLFNGKPYLALVQLLLDIRSKAMRQCFHRLDKDRINLRQFGKQRTDQSFADVAAKFKNETDNYLVDFTITFNTDEGKQDTQLSEPPKQELMQREIKHLEEILRLLLQLKAKFMHTSRLYCLAVCQWTIYLVSIYQVDSVICWHAKDKKERTAELSEAVRRHLAKHRVHVSKAVNLMYELCKEIGTPPSEVSKSSSSAPLITLFSNATANSST